MTVYSAAITLILVMDPLGNIPLFLSILKSYSAKRYRWIIFRETLIAFVILILFLLFGNVILRGLNISQASLSMAGGIILFLIALKMIFPGKDNAEQVIDGEPLIVPLAVPLIAGPSALAAVLLLGARSPGKMDHWLLALTIAITVSFVILLSGRIIMRVFKKRGVIAMERLMGMILTTVAVEMFLNGVSYFMSHPS